MDNSINFKGAFLLHKPTVAVKKSILPTLGKHKQIFNNFINEGDVLYITRKGADKNIAEFLTHHRTKFKYYPELSTKSGFDGEKPIEAKQILDDYKDKIVTTASELKSIFKFNKFLLSFSTRKKDNTLEKCMETLKLDFQEYDIKKLNGFNEVYTKDRDKKLVATISEPGQYGFRYVRIEPKTSGDEVERYAVRDGETFRYINNPDKNIKHGTTEFLKNFMKAVKANKQPTRTAAHQ